MFGEILRILRENAGLTCRDIQEMTGISKERISAYEARRALPKTTNVIILLSNALGIDRRILLTAVCIDDDVKGRLVW